MSEEVVVPTNFQYLRPRQQQELREESKGLGEGLKGPNPHGMDRGDMARRKRAIDQMLEQQAPPDLSPSQRDDFSKEEKRLREQWTLGMLSGEVMRKNPPGAVDHNLAWSRKNAKRISRWKNIQRALHKGDDSPNIANIERFRPHSSPQDPSMHDVQIDGKTFIGLNPSEEFKEGFDRTFGAPGTESEIVARVPGMVVVEPQKSHKRKSSKPVPKGPMLCGEIKALRCHKMHEKHCKKCQEILAADAAPQTA